MSYVLNETLASNSSKYLKINIIKVSVVVTVHRNAMQGSYVCHHNFRGV